MLALIIFVYFNLLLLCHGQNTLNISNQNIKDPIDEHIERPCESFDKFCIRQFLTQHSDCKPMDGPVPYPLYQDRVSGYAPIANVTITANALTIRGLNGRIEEFYINRVTDKLVLAVEFTNLYAGTNYANLRFHRRAQEPLVYNSFASINFTSAIQTIIIPNLKDLQLERSEVFTYSSDLPRLIIGPGLDVEGIDPQVPRALSELYGNFRAAVQELILAPSPYYIGSYIQYSLCDFGIKLI